MKNQSKRRESLPRGFCKNIAEIVGSDQYYVSKVLNDPEDYNGLQAQAIKLAAVKLNEQLAQLKASFQEDSSPVNP